MEYFLLDVDSVSFFSLFISLSSFSWLCVWFVKWPSYLIPTALPSPSLLNSRLEYEQKRDVESRIRKLESSLSTLENDLKQVKKKEGDVKSATETATGDITRWKEEMRGTIWFSVYL